MVTAQTRLVVVRGNSGSGKTTVAKAIREKYGRGVALVHQDVFRREVLRELEYPGAVNIGLIDTAVRYALDHGFHTVLEGILRTDYYGEMLTALHRDYADRSHFFYIDVSFEETLRRHQSKDKANEFGGTEMRSWYRNHDVLPGGFDHVIDQDSTEEATVRTVLDISGLLDIPVPGKYEPPTR